MPGAVLEEQPGLKEAVSLSAGWTETIAVFPLGKQLPFSGLEPA